MTERMLSKYRRQT